MLVKVTITREVPIGIKWQEEEVEKAILFDAIEEIAQNVSLDPMFDCREHLKSMNFRDEEIEKIMQIFIPTDEETYIVELVQDTIYQREDGSMIIEGDHV